jgi:hypothetical protein
VSAQESRAAEWQEIVASTGLRGYFDERWPSGFKGMRTGGPWGGVLQRLRGAAPSGVMAGCSKRSHCRGATSGVMARAAPSEVTAGGRHKRSHWGGRRPKRSHCEGPKAPWQSGRCPARPSYKSRHSGFSDSIKAIFRLREAAFSCFSREIAL